MDKRTKMEVKIVGQDDRRVHFQVLDKGKVRFDNPDFDKFELIELITEGNYDVEEGEETASKP